MCECACVCVDMCMSMLQREHHTPVYCTYKHIYCIYAECKTKHTSHAVCGASELIVCALSGDAIRACCARFTDGGF